MDTTPYKPLLDLLHTKAQADKLLSQADAFVQTLFETKGDINQKLSASFTYEFKDKFVECCEKANIGLSDTFALQAFVNKLLELVKSLNVSTLKIAFDPKDSQIAAFASWFEANSNQKILLNVIVDPSLVGGASVSFGGKFAEFTLKKRLEEKYKLGDLRTLLKD